MNNLSKTIELFVNNMECNKNHIIEACIKNDFDTLNLLIKKKINIDIDCLRNGCLSFNKNILNLLLRYNNNLDISCLENACLAQNVDNVKLILDYRIFPNKKCFINVFKNINEKYRYDSYYLTKHRQDIINLLINYGYKPNFEDVLLALKNKCKINDIERFDIPLNSILLEHCYEYNYFPYNIKAKPTINCLREECKKVGNLKSIKEIINNYGVKPDIKCLQNACDNRSNISVVNLLTESGIKPDLECIKKTAMHFNQNQTLMHLLKEYNKNSTKTTEFKNLQYNSDDINNPNLNTIIPTKYKNIEKIESNDEIISKNSKLNELIDIKYNKKILINHKEELKIKNKAHKLLNTKKNKITFFELEIILLNI